MKRYKVKLKDTQQIREYNRALRSGSKTQHVVKHDNGWAVKRSGAAKASVVYEKQSIAINKATKIARNYSSNIVIHGRDGRIRDVRRVEE